MKLYDIIRELIEREQLPLGPGGSPLIEKEKDNFALEWTNEIRKIAKENNHKIVLKLKQKE